MEQDRVELSTPALSERCSNQLSYCSKYIKNKIGSRQDKDELLELTKKPRVVHLTLYLFLKKEVIQPHLPVRLPCYDFTPLTKHTLESGLLAVSLPALGILDSDGVTGGVYKARERIHRTVLMCDY